MPSTKQWATIRLWLVGLDRPSQGVPPPTWTHCTSLASDDLLHLHWRFASSHGARIQTAAKTTSLGGRSGPQKRGFYPLPKTSRLFFRPRLSLTPVCYQIVPLQSALCLYGHTRPYSRAGRGSGFDPSSNRPVSSMNC